MESESRSQTAHDSTTQEPPQIGLSVLVSPKNASIDIIFVHGFTGHPKTTWMYTGSADTDASPAVQEDQGYDNGEEQRPFKMPRMSFFFAPDQPSIKTVFWPQDLLPKTFPSARILTYGYDSRLGHVAIPHATQTTVYGIARTLLQDLEASRDAQPTRPLLFIAHSLGGIIVKEALRQSKHCKDPNIVLRNVYESTAGVLFFGTPHSGADPRGSLHHMIQELLGMVGFRWAPQIVNALLPPAERLKELRDEFTPMARNRKWIIYSFQEVNGVTALYGRKVVEDASACLNDPTIETTQFIHSNHMDMCRFKGLDDKEYRKVVRAIERVITAITTIHPVAAFEQKDVLMESLRFDSIDHRYATIKNAHARTCQWILNKNEYKHWVDDNRVMKHHGFLWMKGKPATGKSTMMKVALAATRRQQNSKNCVIVSFFFNARGEQLDQSVIGMYRSLLYQILQQLPRIKDKFDPLDWNTGNVGNSWSVETLKNLFACSVKNLGEQRLICFIDALDECEEDEVRDMVSFLERLGQYAVSKGLNFRVLFSSRHYPSITIEKGIELVLERQREHQDDIENYVNSELTRGPKELIKKLKDKILKRASGIFLWVILVIKMLKKEMDRGRLHAIEEQLDNIPTGLDALFQDILIRDNENVRELVLCLQWLLFAQRPLFREELYFAIMAGNHSQDLKEWVPEEITMEYIERFILNCSKGMAEFTKSRPPRVQFIHESVRDFFLGGHGFDRLRARLGSNVIGISHARLKVCCSIYMQMDFSGHLPPGDLPAANTEAAEALRTRLGEKFPFLKYAVQNILRHADMASAHGVSQGRFVTKFEIDYLSSWIRLDNVFQPYQIRRHTPGCEPLYLFAEYDLPNLIRIERARVKCIDIKGERHGTPLVAVLAHGSRRAMKALLVPRGHCYSTYFETRTSGLAELWAQSANEISRARSTLLIYAVKHAQRNIVSLIVSSGQVDVNRKDSHGLTPLKLAIQSGCGPVMKILVAAPDIELGTRDENLRTILSYAAEAGFHKIVKLVIDKRDTNININATDRLGRTPLWYAASNGHAAVVERLVETRHINLNLADHEGTSPLSIAVQKSHLSVVMILLAQPALDVTCRNQAGLSSLSIAIHKGNAEVFKALTESGRFDLNFEDSSSRTPLLRSVGFGRSEMVKILVETGKVDLHKGGSKRTTPLELAQQRKQIDIVEILKSAGATH